MIRADRVSRCLSMAAVENLSNAAEFAYLTDRPLNRSIAINLTNAGIDDPHSFLTLFLMRAGDWLRDHDADLCYVYVIENKGGLNVHILIHVPPQLHSGFAHHQRGWLKQAGCKAVKAGVIKTRILPAPKHGEGKYLVELENALFYFSKGADERICRMLGIRRTPQGIVQGKRAGTSESIGAAARRSHLPGAYGPTVRRRRLVVPRLVSSTVS